MATQKVHIHPDLLAEWEAYLAIADFDDGSPRRVAKYLRQHASETDGTAEGKRAYATRVARLYNINFCNPYLTMHWGQMSRPIVITGMDSEAMQEIQDDATGFGQDYVEASRARLWYYIRDGRVGTLVDGPQQIAGNAEDARTAGERSYQVVYEAAQILYWDYFTSGPRKGQLKELVLCEGRRLGEDGKSYEELRRFVQPEEDGALFRWESLRGEEGQWGSGDTQPSSTREHTLVEEGTGGLSYIPFVLMGVGPEESFLKDVWPLNLAYLNLLSVLSNIIYNQGFQRSIFAGIDKEEITKLTEWTVTVTSNPAANIFTIPPGDPAAAFNELARLERQIHRRAKFEYNQLADDTRQVQSAESKVKDLVVQIVIYNSVLDKLEQVEESIYRTHAEFEGTDPEAISVTIGRDFGLEDEAAEDLALQSVFVRARELGVVELQKEILKMDAAKLRLLPAKDETEEDVRARVLKAIDDAGDQGSRLGQFLLNGGANVRRLDETTA